MSYAYLLFVIFFTQTKFFENKIYTEKRANYDKLHSKLSIFRVKSVKIYTGQFFFTLTCLWCLWQISGMTRCSRDAIRPQPLRMFFSSILNKLSIFVQLSTPIQTQSSYFVKTLAWIWKVSLNWHFFCIILEKITWAQKYLTQVPLVPLVTNSMSASGDTIYSLQADFIARCTSQLHYDVAFNIRGIN